MPKRVRSRGSLTPVEAGRSRQCQPKRAGLLAFSAALGTALVTAPFPIWAAKQPPPGPGGLHFVLFLFLWQTGCWPKGASTANLGAARIARRLVCTSVP